MRIRPCVNKSKVNPLEKSPRRKRGIKQPPNSPISPKPYSPISPKPGVSKLSPKPKPCLSKSPRSCCSKDDLVKSPRAKACNKMEVDLSKSPHSTEPKSPKTRSGKVPVKYDLTRPPISPRRPKPALVIRKPKRAVNLCHVYERPTKDSNTKDISILESAILEDKEREEKEERSKNEMLEEVVEKDEKKYLEETEKDEKKDLEETESVINEVHKEIKPFSEKNIPWSCVSMKTDIPGIKTSSVYGSCEQVLTNHCSEDDGLDLPPPPVIRRTWKKAQVSSGYKLFSPDSPAKASYSPHLLSVKLCLARFDSESGKTFELPVLPQREFKSKRSLIR